MKGLGALEIALKIPDLWQQQAVRGLSQGRDVVVDAPTGAGKTFIFELLVRSGYRKQAVFTVPTRALANDKLYEWRSRGWNVGIATGDVAENLNAPVVVATLETQKSRFLERSGPGMLVVDEYQMLADSVRGVNYELAIALAPPETQLLLLSGSVGNPGDVVDWLRRIGRDALLVSHRERPVPLEEVVLDAVRERVPPQVRGFWPRLVAKALMADLGPILIFAPQRKAAEQLARHLSAALPVIDPLVLSKEQRTLAGDRLEKMLKNRVAFHHSGLSYAQRAGLIEPLAKAGQLRVVVATTGLAAGINFSMRSVLVTEIEYTVSHFQRLVRPDELLQMFGRAGRRGLDEIGYVLVAPDRPRLSEAKPLRVRRADPVEWPSLISVMSAAAARGESSFAAAAGLSERLFSAASVPLGIEHSLVSGPQPCGLMIDAQRARHAQPIEVQMENSQGHWEVKPESRRVRLADARVRVKGRWRAALTRAETLRGVGQGNLCLLGSGDGRIYGREVPLAVRDAKREGRFSLVRRFFLWLRERLELPDAGARSGRRFPYPRYFDEDLLREAFVPRAADYAGGTFDEVIERNGLILARVRFDELPVDAFVDAFGVALIQPSERKAFPAECQGCSELTICETQLRRARSPALSWFQLGLIDGKGIPTRRGELFSFFHHGEGLAVAAALEEETYPVETLLFDLANLRAGHRFAEHARTSSRLAIACRTVFGEQDFEGYLERGLPLQYGDGAAEVLAAVAGGDARKGGIFDETLRPGDVERARLEWHSLLRHIVYAPEMAWPRWIALRDAARSYLDENRVAGLAPQYPAMMPNQLKRVDHRLRFR